MPAPHNEDTYRKLRNGGISHGAALALADEIGHGGTVANPAALTAPATMSGTYTQAEVQKLRADIAALRTTLDTLVTELRNAGVVL